MRALRRDIIIVLGCQHRASLIRRIERGIELHRASPAVSLLLCGGYGEALSMAEMAKAAGVPAAALILETQSRTTAENAFFAEKIIAEHGWHHAAIVSDCYHLPRAKLCFRATPLKSLELISCAYPATAADRYNCLCAFCRELLALPIYLMRPKERMLRAKSR